MTHTLIKRQMAVAIACAFGLDAVSAASAQTTVDKSGYLTDTRGDR